MRPTYTQIVKRYDGGRRVPLKCCIGCSAVQVCSAERLPSISSALLLKITRMTFCADDTVTLFCRSFQTLNVLEPSMNAACKMYFVVCRHSHISIFLTCNLAFARVFFVAIIRVQAKVCNIHYHNSPSRCHACSLSFFLRSFQWVSTCGSYHVFLSQPVVNSRVLQLDQVCICCQLEWVLIKSGTNGSVFRNWTS